MRFGSWLLERGHAPAYGYVGATKEGSGGLWEHAYHQGYDSVRRGEQEREEGARWGGGLTLNRKLSPEHANEHTHVTLSVTS